MASPLHVFLYYAHEDDALRQELEKHLAAFQHQNLILIWHDHKIIAGTDRQQAINAHLNTAHLILILVSPDFMASGYWHSAEMRQAIERHEKGQTRVIPIIVRPTYWQVDPLERLEALPTDAEPVTLWRNHDAAFFNIAQGILQAIADFQSNTPIQSSLAHLNKKNPFVVPKAQSLATNAIYLVRAINPPDNHFGYTTNTATIWLAAEGNTTYIVDSITIRHWDGHLLSGAGRKSGAAFPDANYVFQIQRDGVCTYPLSPALILSHQDHQEVSFTLRLEFPGFKWEGMGSGVEVILHYHSLDGVQGILYVRRPPAAGILLSRLLKTDVEVDGCIITPKGFQRGKIENGENEDTKTLLNEPLRFPLNDFLEKESASSFPKLSLTPERQTLNEAIQEQAALPFILELLRAGDLLAFDLCAGLPCLECEQALFQVGTSNHPQELNSDQRMLKSYIHSAAAITENIVEATIRALSIRHMLQPNNTLADFLLTLSRAPSNTYLPSWSLYPSWNLYMAFFSLITFRSENYLDAILYISTLHQGVYERLLGILSKEEKDLEEEDVQKIVKLVQDEFFKYDEQKINHIFTLGINYLLEKDFIHASVHYLLNHSFPGTKITTHLSQLRECILKLAATPNQDKWRRKILKSDKDFLDNLLEELDIPDEHRK